jgi:hypothetical protein
MADPYPVGNAALKARDEAALAMNSAYETVLKAARTLNAAKAPQRENAGEMLRRAGEAAAKALETATALQDELARVQELFQAALNDIGAAARRRALPL